MAHARRLIDAHQYVLESVWGEVQPTADDENRYLETHSWDEYSAWHLGLSDGASEGTKAPIRLRLRRFPAGAPDGSDRLSVPGGRVATQANRARRARAAPAPRQHPSLNHPSAARSRRHVWQLVCRAATPHVHRLSPREIAVTSQAKLERSALRNSCSSLGARHLTRRPGRGCMASTLLHLQCSR